MASILKNQGTGNDSTSYVIASSFNPQNFKYRSSNYFGNKSLEMRENNGLTSRTICTTSAIIIDNVPPSTYSVSIRDNFHGPHISESSLDLNRSTQNMTHDHVSSGKMISDLTTSQKFSEEKYYGLRDMNSESFLASGIDLDKSMNPECFVANNFTSPLNRQSSDSSLTLGTDPFSNLFYPSLMVNSSSTLVDSALRTSPLSTSVISRKDIENLCDQERRDLSTSSATINTMSEIKSSGFDQKDYSLEKSPFTQQISHNNVNWQLNYGESSDIFNFETVNIGETFSESYQNASCSSGNVPEKSCDDVFMEHLFDVIPANQNSGELSSENFLIGMVPGSTITIAKNDQNQRECRQGHKMTELHHVHQINCLASKDRCVEQSQQHIDDKFSKSCKCKACRRSFKDVFSLNYHIYRKHERMTKPTCMRCSAKFVTMSSFHHHLRKHKRLLSKDISSKSQHQQQKTVSSSSSVEWHIPITFEEMVEGHPPKLIMAGKFPHHSPAALSVFRCRECGKEYKHNKSLKAHVRLKHSNTPKKIRRCRYCSRSFSWLWQLNNHVSWWHLGKKPYICQYCGQGFVCLPTLRRHQRTVHTGEKPYRCVCCHEKFFEKKSLDLHKAHMHTGIFPFVCSQCGRGFVHRCYLKNHLKIHSGLRPCKCLICGKQYSKISHLKRHQVSCFKKNVQQESALIWN